MAHRAGDAAQAIAVTWKKERPAGRLRVNAVGDALERSC